MIVVCFIHPFIQSTVQYNLDAAYHLTFEMTTLLLEMGSSGKRATGGASGSTLCFSCVEDFCLLLSHNQPINQPINPAISRFCGTRSSIRTCLSTVG